MEGKGVRFPAPGSSAWPALAVHMAAPRQPPAEPGSFLRFPWGGFVAFATREAPAWEQLSGHSLDGFAVRSEVWQLPADRSPQFPQKPDFRAFHQPSISRISLPSSEPPPFPRRLGSPVWRCGFLKLCLSPACSGCADTCRSESVEFSSLFTIQSLVALVLGQAY